MKNSLFAFFCLALAFQSPGASIALGQEAASAGEQAAAATGQDNASLTREQRIANYLTGAKFLGSFSVDSKGFGALKEEAYTISKCEKLPEGDMYRLTARIKYGDTDGEFPMDLQILWAGNTPVITLDQVWIPGLGTFSARVLILNGRYAGTWDHDAVGGHMFGRVIKENAKP
jgi:hypothetical protein